MKILSELEERLEENQGRIDNLVQHLERHSDLQRAFVNAEQGLLDAGKSIAHLAESARTAVESLNSVQAAFKQIVDLLQRADPEKVAQAVAQVERRLQAARKETAEDIKRIRVVSYAFMGVVLLTVVLFYLGSAA